MRSKPFLPVMALGAFGREDGCVQEAEIFVFRNMSDNSAN